MDHCHALQRLADRLSSLIRVAGCMDEWFEELLVLPGVKLLGLKTRTHS